MQVTSNEHPDQVQLLQGKKLINIDVTKSVIEIDGESVTSYIYTQLAVDITTDTDTAIAEYRAEIARDYLDSTDYIDNKYVSEVLVLGTTTAEEFKVNHSEIYDKREAARVVIRGCEDAILS